MLITSHAMDRNGSRPGCFAGATPLELKCSSGGVTRGNQATLDPACLGQNVRIKPLELRMIRVQMNLRNTLDFLIRQLRLEVVKSFLNCLFRVHIIPAVVGYLVIILIRLICRDLGELPILPL